MSLIPINLDQEVTDFQNTCINGYNTYYYLEETSVASYDLIVVIGEYNNQVGYSIFFRPAEPYTYYLILEINGQEVLSTNKDYEVLNLYNLVIDKELTINVKYEKKTTYSLQLKSMSYDEYITNYTNKLLPGNNGGLEVIKLGPTKTTPTTMLFSIIFCLLILLSIIIILVLYIFKKGLFNEEKANKEFEEEHQIRSMIEEETNNIEIEVIEEEPVEVYETKIEDEDIERDITLILKNKGFNTNYSEMTNEEKNKVMLELMRMRDFKEITQEEYRREVINLWI